MKKQFEKTLPGITLNHFHFSCKDCHRPWGPTTLMKFSPSNLYIYQKQMNHVEVPDDVIWGRKKDERFGSEFGNIILFQSKEYENPADAMEEFNKFELPDKPPAK